MPRWEPGAAPRLVAAALELFAAQGFDATTSAEIAAAAGLTQRTFFRYFADKRDVLFAGQDEFVEGFLAGVADAPDAASPMDLVAASLAAGAAFFPDERRAHSRLRQQVIDATPALRERERHKLADLAVTLADALRERGVGDPAATLAAESGTTVFGLAFAQWQAEGETRPLGVIAADLLDELARLNRAPTS